MENFYKDYSLKNYNSFGFEATARFFYEFEFLQEIKHFINNEIGRHSLRKILGAGNNILLTDDIQGIVIRSINKDFEIIEENRNDVLIRVGAGYDWDNLVEESLKQGFFGLENLSLIPGSVGAAPIQNIGAYGVEIEQFIEHVNIIDLNTSKTYTLNHQQCKFDYRHSVFKLPDYKYFMVLSVEMRLLKEPKVNLSYKALSDAFSGDKNVTPQQIREKVMAIRQSKLPDPKKVGNAGSFFKNPIISQNEFNEIVRQYPTVPHWPIAGEKVKLSAAWMIEQCGFKGYISSNGVGVSPTQSLVLINVGAHNGTAILELSSQIMDAVFQKFNVRIEPEVNIW
ncbi:MAG TPA: UDP-N-acetylmuramate dehydrogenase [Salinivirgaceae bacterium]|nr:UDP-N-acetylmuramate dehydrogenase [Salinivirgaceae bacterium]